jgi:hypothetical protein
MMFVVALFAALVSSTTGGHMHVHIPSDILGGPIT